MSEVNMRFVEELDTGDKVITYYSVKELDNKFYYVYDGVNHGPFGDFDDVLNHHLRILFLALSRDDIKSALVGTPSLGPRW
jgi:hypothetical protein